MELEAALVLIGDEVQRVINALDAAVCGTGGGEEAP
jgi:hypothetical protein